MRILLVSTPVGPLGSGVGGGVELTLQSLVRGLGVLGHDTTVLAPSGSVLAGAPVVPVEGEPQVPAQFEGRDAPVTLPARSVLAALWDEVRRRAGAHDVVLNLAYDWLPFYVAPFLEVPVAHLVSMGSLSDAMDEAVARSVADRPGSVAVHTDAQARTFGPLAPSLARVGSGIDPSRYRFVADPDPALAFVGRIAPEKGLEDAVAVAAAVGRPLRVWGLLQDEWVLKDALERTPGAEVDYRGFLPTAELQAGLGRCSALLMTPHWVEAFGNVAVEALACGVPVVAYARGGPAEIVRHGVTGYLTPPGDVAAMAAAVRRVTSLDRSACRRDVEDRWSDVAFAARVAAWLAGVARA